MSLELAFKALFVITCVVGGFGVIHAFVTKMREPLAAESAEDRPDRDSAKRPAKVA